MEWNHSICAECWNKQNPQRSPHALRNDPVKKCCFCGQDTSAGIYVRHDPRLLSCAANHVGGKDGETHR